MVTKALRKRPLRNGETEFDEDELASTDEIWLPEKSAGLRKPKETSGQKMKRLVEERRTKIGGSKKRKAAKKPAKKKPAKKTMKKTAKKVLKRRPAKKKAARKK